MKAYNLETANQHRERITELYLHGLNIAVWPSVVFELPQLQLLCLSGNRLRELPGDISRLTRLRSLDLSGNQLQALPVALQKLKDLEELNLSGNQFSRFPAIIGKMTGLRLIDLGYNRLRTLPPHLGNASRLKVLRLNHNRIRELPAEWERLEHLEELHLDQNQISLLPDWVGNLRSLQVLNLAENKLGEIPPRIGKLGGLRILNLDRNRLSGLPVSLGDLRELAELNVRRNLLGDLPQTIGQLRGLRRLLLDENQLTVLPAALEKLQALRMLSCQGNRLDEWPSFLGQLPRLEAFDLGRNQLQVLPDEPGKWQGLERLGLQRNKLSALPEAFCRFPRLKELDLGRNSFSGFPECLVLSPSLEKVSGVSNVSRAMRFIQACRQFSVPESCRKDLFSLWQGRSEAGKLPAESLQYGLRLSLPSLRRSILAFLLRREGAPIDPRKSVIRFTGKTRLSRNDWKKRLEEAGFESGDRGKKAPTHVVLGDGCLDIPVAWLKRNVAFLEETDLFQEIRGREEVYLQTLDDPARLGRLLQSRQESSLRLSVSLMKNGGVPPSLMTDLFLAWKTAGDRGLKKELRNLLLLHASGTGKRFLEKARAIRSGDQAAEACEGSEFDPERIRLWWETSFPKDGSIEEP